MQKNYPSVSVVIPVRNEAAKIRACIEGILMQTVPVKEIIVVDSGSTDGTLEILAEYEKVKVYSIPPSEFNHGLTRNYGAGKATGEFVLLTVGDARAVDKFWIEELLKGFTGDDVAGVCGSQVVPHERDKNPVQWFRPQDKPAMRKYQVGSEEEFNALPAQRRKEACSWDDVSAMYRREVMQRIPFVRTSFCEDAIWAKEALLAGYTLVYNPAARVYHYHLEDSDFAFKQCFTIMYYRYRYMNYLYSSPALSARQKLSIVKTLLKTPGLSMKERLHWLRYNLRQDKAFTRAYNVFMDSLAKSEKVLDETHQKYCGKPPIPLKQKVNANALG